ncbi:MAG: formimidoylglutamase [Bacteroidales bacterium]
MNLNDYFNPVSLDPPETQFLPVEHTLAGQIRKHTPDQPIPEVKDYVLAIMGIPEDRNSENTGSAEGPDHIRKCLYQLSGTGKHISVIDLGNIKPGKNPVDTYYAVREVNAYLIETGICPILMGGTQDLTLGMYMAYRSLNIRPSLVTIDSRLDLPSDAENATPGTYLEEVLFGENPALFHYTNLGHQVYHLSRQQLERLRSNTYESIGIGQIRADMKETEPIFRDADIISLDISSVKQSDAPGYFSPSPNGFYSEEICQLAKYAGAGNRPRCFGVFETNPKFDTNDQTSRLAAEIIWYYMDGFSGWREEFPRPSSEEFTKYMVNLSEPDHTLVFYKSIYSGRWWCEVPVISGDHHEVKIIACSYEDYLKASNQEVPERWLRFYQKLN